jgi:hypothetical protein
MEEIHADIFASIREAFLSQLKTLLMHDYKKIRTVIITINPIDDPIQESFSARQSEGFSWMVYNWLAILPKVYADQHFTLELMSHGSSAYPFIALDWIESVLGTSLLTKHEIQLFNKYGPPLIIPRNKMEPCEISSAPWFADSRPSYIIDIGNKCAGIILMDLHYNPIYVTDSSIAISPGTVKFACSLLRNNGCIKTTTGYIEWQVLG